MVEGSGTSREGNRYAGLELELGDTSRPDGDDEVWFDAEALARASRVELDPGGLGLLRPGEGASLLDPAAVTPRLSVASLPGPPRGGRPDGVGLGLGRAFDELTFGLGPGATQWFRSEDAQGAAGVRDLIGQIGEGLALSSALGQDSDASDGAALAAPVFMIPVVRLCSGDRRDAELRRLARWTGLDAQLYRLGAAGIQRVPELSPEALERALEAARGALEGPLGHGGAYLRYVVPQGAPLGLELLAHLTDAVQGWREQLAGREGRATLPLVIVDDLERWASPAAEGPAALEALWRGLIERARVHGWTVLVHAAHGPSRSAPPLDAALGATVVALDDTGAALRIAHLPGYGLGRPVEAVTLRWELGCGRVGPAAGTGGDAASVASSLRDPGADATNAG